MELKTIILESNFNLFYVDVVIKTEKLKTTKLDAFNQIRALPDVITVNPLYIPQIDARETDVVEYSYVKMKFLSSSSNPTQEMYDIRARALRGFDDKHKIVGLMQFIIREKTIKKVK